MRMTGPRYLVKVSDEYERVIGTGINGLPILVSTLDTKSAYAHIQPEGTVVAIPENGRGVVITSQYQGFPHPLRYFSGEDAAITIHSLMQTAKNQVNMDTISRENERIYEKLDNKRLDKSLEARKSYQGMFENNIKSTKRKVNCAGFDSPKRFNSNEFGTDKISVGDTVYLSYLALGPNQDENGETVFLNFMYRDIDGKNVYMVNAAHMLGYKKGNDVVMVNGYMAIEPLPHPDIEEVVVDGKPMMARKMAMTNGTIVVPLVEKATRLRGRVVYTCATFPLEFNGYNLVRQGDEVLYTPDSEEKYRINGKEVYVMKTWEAVASVEENTFYPNGDYVALKVENFEINTKFNMHIPDPVDINPFMTDGKVMRIGPDVKELKLGDIAIFNGKQNGNKMGFSLVYVPDMGWNYTATVKPSNQLIMRKGMILVREADILGVRL